MPRVRLRLVLLLGAALAAPPAARAQLGIDLSAPQKDKEKKKEAPPPPPKAAPQKPAEPLVLQPLDVTAKGAARQRLDAAMLGRFSTMAMLNPVAPILEGLDGAIVDGTAPDAGWFAYSVVMAVLLLWGGYGVFKHLEYRFAESV